MSSGDDTEMYIKYWEAFVAWLICMNVALEAALLGLPLTCAGNLLRLTLETQFPHLQKWNDNAHFHSYYFLFFCIFYWRPLCRIAQGRVGGVGWGGWLLTLADVVP